MALSKDEIKTAYQVQNLRPIRGFFLRNDFACPIVALAIHRGVVKRDDPIADGVALQWAVETFGRGWVKGFLDGFDGQTRSIDDPAYPNGFAVGNRLVQAFLCTKESGQTS